MKHLLRAAGLCLCGLAACHSDSSSPAAESPVPDAHPYASMAALRSGDAEQNTVQDTLLTADGSVLRLKPATAADFTRVPAQLPRYLDSTLTAGTAPVGRQGDDLLLRPAQGPEVRLHSVLAGPAGPDDPTGRVVYRYWGELPTAHQWVVTAEKASSFVTTLIDQRTGQQTEVVGEPSVSPDGRYLLGVRSDQYNDGSDESATGIQLFQLGDAAPKLLWTRQPVNWGATHARWSSPRTVLLEQERSANSQEEAGPPPTYVELTLPEPKP